MIDEVDRWLPPHVRILCFGAKGTALPYLVGHERYRRRIVSTDSQAWDYAARASMRSGRTMEHRLGHLDRWLQQQAAAQAAPKRLESSVVAERAQRIRKTVRDVVAARLAEAMLDGDIEYEDAAGSLDRATCWATAYAAQHRLDAEIDESEILQWIDDNPM
ncbi:MAG: hypothetical protein V4684_04580 [Pseudomonadota bacterium]